MSTSTSPGWLTPSLIVLVLANLIPVYGTLFLGWDVFPLLMLFWLENVAIGLLNVPKMLLASGPVGGREWQAAALNMRRTMSAKSLRAWAWGAKLFVAVFFCVHYGVFAEAHGSFLIHMFGPEDIKQFGFIPGPGIVVHIVKSYDLGVAALALAASHGFSFAWNYLAGGGHRRTNVMRQMIAPYPRVAALHGALMLGGGLVMLIGSPTAALVAFVALKVGFDGRAHLKEHRSVRQAPRPPKNAVTP